MIEVLQVFAHLFQYILHRNIDLLHNTLVDISYYLLDNFELLEQFAARL